MGRQLRALVDACALLLLVALDARDVWFKLRWLGPDDRFAFPADQRAVLSADTHTEPLPPQDALDLSNATHWGVFLDRCATLAPFRGGRAQHALASDCLLAGDRGGLDEQRADRLVLTRDVRADAVAWAACRLLRVPRRPPVCHEALVTDFLRRFQLPAPHVAPQAMAVVMSSAERELLGVLEVIAKSSPLSAAVCASGFEPSPANASAPSAAAVHTPAIFGCGRPNGQGSAFVGRFATAFAALQADKAWLDMDVVRALDLRFRVRQSARASYTLTATHGKALVLETHAAVSLSCSGPLYHLMLLLDVVLLAIHAWSALELSRVLLRPHASLQSEPETAGAHMNRLSFLACSLARSAPVVALTLAASGLSWLLVLPLSAALQLSRSPAVTLHAYLTLLRLWSLLLLAVNAAWDLVVLLSEKRAYFVTSRTFVASWELAAVTLGACYLLRGRWSDLRVSEREGGWAGGGDDVAALRLWNVYAPLAQLLLASLAVVAALLAVRYAISQRSRSDNGRNGVGATAAAIAGYSRLPLEELLDEPIRARNLVRYGAGLERCVGSERVLWAVQHLAHGVLVENKRFLGARRGFLHPLPAHLPADGRGLSCAREADEEEPSGSPKRRRYVSPLRH